MSCDAHRDCPTYCRDWEPCMDQPCEHESCAEALAQGAYNDAALAGHQRAYRGLTAVYVPAGQPEPGDILVSHSTPVVIR